MRSLASHKKEEKKSSFSIRKKDEQIIAPTEEMGWLCSSEWTSSIDELSWACACGDLQALHDIFVLAPAASLNELKTVTRGRNLRMF